VDYHSPNGQDADELTFLNPSWRSKNVNSTAFAIGIFLGELFNYLEMILPWAWPYSSVATRRCSRPKGRVSSTLPTTPIRN